ncbi:MAG: hypothetical protein RR089_02275 [Acidaminococcaceae bacterium]
MKKILLLVMSLFLVAQVGVATAGKATNWEISMMPKATAEEQELLKWSFILENDYGVYAYNPSTIAFTKNEDGSKNLELVTAEIKTVFTNTEALKKINAGYAEKLKKGDQTAYCTLQMVFNLQANTYANTAIKVVSGKGKILEERKIQAIFAPIPEQSFAEAMLEIINKYLVENREELLLN